MDVSEDDANALRDPLAQTDDGGEQARANLADKRGGCVHEGCPEILPRAPQIPPGWTVAKVEEHRDGSILTYVIYCCPGHKLATVPAQAQLFEEVPG